MITNRSKALDNSVTAWAVGLAWMVMAAECSTLCPAACDATCEMFRPSLGDNAAFLLSGSRSVREFTYNRTSVEALNASSLPGCSVEDWSRIYRGVRVDSIAWLARALLVSGDTWTSKSLLRSVMSRQSNNKYGTLNGSAICALQTLGYKYRKYPLLPPGDGACYLFEWVASHDEVDTGGEVPIEFPSGVARLSSTVMIGLSSLAVDAASMTTITPGGSLSGIMLEYLMTVLELMNFDFLFAESPELVDGSFFNKKTVQRQPVRLPHHQQLTSQAAVHDGRLGAAVTLHPLPPVHTLSRSRSLSQTENVTEAPNSTAASSTTSAAPNTTHAESTATEATSTTTQLPTTTQTFSTTSVPTTPATTSAISTTTLSPPSTATTGTTTTTAPPSTTIPTTAAPQTPAPTSAPNYHAKMSTQLLLRAWVNGILALAKASPVILSPLQLRYAQQVANETETALGHWFCSAPSLTNASTLLHIPHSVDLQSMTYNDSVVDPWTQCVSIAASGTRLDDTCDKFGLGYRILKGVVQRFGVSSPTGLVGISRSAGGSSPDVELTAVCLMAAQKLQSAYLPSFKDELAYIISCLSSNTSALTLQDCLVSTDEAGAFGIGVPSTTCGGPLVSLGTTALRWLALSSANPFDVSGILPPPPATLSPTPIAAPSQTLNLVIGACVGAVVLVAVAVVVLRKVRHNPHTEALMQTPTDNLGFY